MLIDVLLVPRNQSLGNGLADSVDLRDVTTTNDADADVDISELVGAQNQKGLVDLYIHPTVSHQFPVFFQFHLWRIIGKFGFGRVRVSRAVIRSMKCRLIGFVRCSPYAGVSE